MRDTNHHVLRRLFTESLPVVFTGSLSVGPPLGENANKQIRFFMIILHDYS
ncbi:MAG: hypothetical protein PHQ75_08900 [Thermoguttaceae bacterium]|nr:hypothetical protein [Thermoguttaceae bacterium]